MSLRNATNIRVEKHGFWIFQTLRFFFTKTNYFELSQNDLKVMDQKLDEHGIAPVGQQEGRVLWAVNEKGGFFWSGIDMTFEEVALLHWDAKRKREAKFDRLRKIKAREEDLAATRRERIPDEVRAFVWERDEGRCVRCGAEDDLQFDHVIPVAKGGGVAADNIQILCGNCNRAKSDSIA